MARRKRMHGKQRRKSSALKQRVSDTNPYTSNSGNVQMHPDLIANIKESFNKPKETLAPSTSKVTSKKSNNKKASEFGKKSLKKELLKKSIKKGSKIISKVGKVPSWLGKNLGVAGLMLDALPAGEGSSKYEYKDGKEYYASGPNKGKPTRDDNFKRINYGV